MCHISELMNVLLPFPLKLLSSRLCLQPVILATTPLDASSSPPTASAVTNALNTTKRASLDCCQDALQEVFMLDANEFTAKSVTFLGLQPNLGGLVVHAL